MGSAAVGDVAVGYQGKESADSQIRTVPQVHINSCAGFPRTQPATEKDPSLLIAPVVSHGTVNRLVVRFVLEFRITAGARLEGLLL